MRLIGIFEDREMDQETQTELESKVSERPSRRVHAGATGEKLHALTPDARVLLTEVNVAESQGWLPEVRWKWIAKRAHSATPQQSSRF
jgi:hypothetical protein